jgi:hypothetical protein
MCKICLEMSKTAMLALVIKHKSNGVSERVVALVPASKLNIQKYINSLEVYAREVVFQSQHGIERCAINKDTVVRIHKGNALVDQLLAEDEAVERIDTVYV